ncbi:MAG: hypothetical protein AAGB51_12945 [Planctomycetota bacterium]
MFPTAEELPENLLRFYIYFSKPMRPDITSNSIRLADQHGNEIDDAFLATDAGLWSSNRQRLTLLLNPGRVKTGLGSSKSLGLAIREGNLYALIIDASATAYDGSAVAEPYLKWFSVTEADRDSPRPERWTLSQPTRNSRDPFVVELDGPTDHASLAYRIRVINGAGGVVRGRLELGHHEQRWTLTPEQPWTDDNYSLCVEHRLEDLAGNRPNRLFEQHGAIEPGGSASVIPISLASPAQTSMKNTHSLEHMTSIQDGTERKAQ